MARLGAQPVKTFSIGFARRSYDELAYARAGRADASAPSTTSWCWSPTRSTILEDLAWHLDEPFGDSSAIPTYMVSQLAAEHVKVVLSGDGGDELFAGYDRYASRAASGGTARCPASRAARSGALAGRDARRHARAGTFCATWRCPASTATSTPSRSSGSDRQLRAAHARGLRADGRPATPGGASATPARDGPGALAVRAAVPRPRRLPAPRHPDQGRPHEHGALDRGARAAARSQAGGVRGHHPSRAAAATASAKYMFKRRCAGSCPTRSSDRPKRASPFRSAAGSAGRLARLRARPAAVRDEPRRAASSSPARSGASLARHERGQEDLDLQLWTLISFELWCRRFLDRQPRGRRPPASAPGRSPGPRDPVDAVASPTAGPIPHDRGVAARRSWRASMRPRIAMVVASLDILGRPRRPGGDAGHASTRRGLRGQLRADQPAVSARPRLAAALPVRAHRAEPGALPAEPAAPRPERRGARLLRLVLVVPARAGAGDAGGAAPRQARGPQLSQRRGRRPSRALGPARPPLAAPGRRDRGAVPVSARRLRAPRLHRAGDPERRGHRGLPLPRARAAAAAPPLHAQPRAALRRRQHARAFALLRRPVPGGDADRGRPRQPGRGRCAGSRPRWATGRRALRGARGAGATCPRCATRPTSSSTPRSWTTSRSRCWRPSPRGCPSCPRRRATSARCSATARRRILVPARDPAAMAGAVAALLDDPDRAIGMARRARQAIEAYTWPQVRERWAAAYGAEV